MGRSYSGDSYGAHKVITLGPKDIGLTTNAGETTVLAHKFLFPAKVIDANCVFLSAVAEDLGTQTGFMLQKSTDAGTGRTIFSTIGINANGATCTFAIGETLDMTVTETSFSAGDEVLFTVEGTVTSLIGTIAINLEVQEVFEQGDS